MNIIITSPSLDPSKNVSGVSSVTQFIIQNNPEHHYIHFELGRKDGERGGIFRIYAILHAYKEWRKLLKQYPKALIHYNFPLEKPSILRDPLFMHAALKNGNKMVIHIHGGVFLTSPKIPFPFNRILKHVFSLEVPFIALSKSESKTLNERFDVKDSVVLPNCVDLRDAISFQRSQKPFKEPLVMGYLGRIAETKGMDFLLQSCRELQKQKVNFKLKLAGAEEIPGKYLPKFKKLGSAFEYCGLVGGKDKYAFLRSLDILAFPSYFEGLPMSLLECMSYGAVPITTPVGSIPTVVKDGYNGLFIKVKDCKSIVKNVKKLENNRQLLHQLSIEARDTIFKEFDPTLYIKNLNQLYRLTI